MSLDEYQKKRDFIISPEPKGDKGDIKIISKEEIKEDVENTKKGTNNIFVIHEHHAKRLHFDLRLEMGGVLRSWAVPKGPPEDYNVRRLAIPTEDHPIEYATFEGTIPQGSYGAGTVKIYDKGEFFIEKEKDNEILFELNGQKLKGKYGLIKIMLKGKESWLFFKRMEF